VALLVTVSAMAACTMVQDTRNPTSFDGQPTPTGISGAALYGQHCSTCHGDRGQGLTPEWRATWIEGHQNCSAPNCHGPNHPNTGFEIKNNYAPALIGNGTLRSFPTAVELGEYVAQSMPVPNPPDIPSRDDHWKVANFLLWTNGYIDVPYGVDDQNAHQITLETRAYPLPTFEPVPAH
jgi:mono/diheme cytochrome c family protein